MADNNKRPQRLKKSTQHPDFSYSFHNHPVEGKKAKEEQKKIKQARMRAQPETLNWDYKFVKPLTANESACAEQCDVQFYTNRVDLWKTVCMAYYGDECKLSVALKKIPGGEQLLVDGHIHMNFFNTGIVLVQGKYFGSWERKDFPLLCCRLNARPAETEPEDGDIEPRPLSAVPSMPSQSQTPIAARVQNIQPQASPLALFTPGRPTSCHHVTP